MNEINTEEAIAWFESRKAAIAMSGARAMYDKAIDALRAQAEAEKNAPLTLDEIREMDGERVWIKRIGGRIPYDHGWAIVHQENCLCRTDDGCNAFFELYGTAWLAYRHEPEEAAHPIWERKQEPPFSVGDKLFFVGYGLVEELQIRALEIHVEDGNRKATFWLSRIGGTTEEIDGSDFGKLAFRTREEAENVLKGETNE